MSTDSEQQALILEALHDLRAYANANMRQHIKIDDEKIKKQNEEKINKIPQALQPKMDKYRHMNITSILFDTNIEENYDHRLFKLGIFLLFLEKEKDEIKNMVKEVLNETDDKHTIEERHIDKIVSYIQLFVKILDN